MKKTHTTGRGSGDRAEKSRKRQLRALARLAVSADVDLSMANLFHAFSELRANTLHGLLRLFYGVYHRHRLKKTPIHLPPPLSQGVKRELLALLAFLTQGGHESQFTPEIANFTQAEEQALAIIEKSFNELPPKVQENVAKVLHRKHTENIDASFGFKESPNINSRARERVR